ncbi:MAG: hypothetical protein ACI4AM_06895 [Muribaculaceae bacterium]
MNDNADKIADARRRGTEPYFIRNNAAAIDDILNPQKQMVQSGVLPQNATDLINHLQANGNLEESIHGGLSEREVYRKWDSLSEEERLQVLERGRYTGMLSTEESLDFANLYQPTTRERMIGILQDELENKRLGHDVEDTNHYIIKFKGDDSVIHSYDLEKPLTAAQLKRIEYISANSGMSNYRYWVANDEAKSALMKYMGFVEYEDGRVIASWNGKDYLSNNLHQLRESKFDKSMKQLRKELVRQQRERLLIVNSKGIVIKRVMGDTRSVSFDDSIADIAKNNWVTHNHPTGKGESGIKRLGYSLSIDDIREAIRCDMRGIIAESPYYRYKIERPSNGWAVDLDVVRKRYSEIYKEIISEYQSSFSYHENLSIILQHLTLKRLANEFGFLYEYMKL